jgi:catalase
MDSNTLPSRARIAARTTVSRRVAILAADGVHEPSLRRMLDSLAALGACGKILGPRVGCAWGSEGSCFPVEISLRAASATSFDAVYVPGGEPSVETLAAARGGVDFVIEAYDLGRPIAATGEAVALVAAATGVLPPDPSVDDAGTSDPGLVLDVRGLSDRALGQFVTAIDAPGSERDSFVAAAAAAGRDEAAR